MSNVGSSADGQDDVRALLGKLQSAETDEYEGIIADILKHDKTTAQLAKIIRKGVAAQPSESRKKNLVEGWSAWEATDSKGVTRPYQIFMPSSVINGKKPAALIVHMHGAVGRPDFGKGLGTPAATGYAGLLWPEVAEAENLVVVCPVGRGECSWWKDNGVSHVDAVIRDVRRTIDFPENSIFGSGFSDGGSGCYYRAMAAPGPFAGFIALNGHPRVAASASGKQIYLSNMSMSTTMAGMTQEDSLYPSKNVIPHILTAIQEGANILTVSYPKMNHQPSYFSEQKTAMLKFIESNKRKSKRHIRWQASSVGIGKFQWMEILGFSDAENAEKIMGSNVMSAPGRMSLGVQLSPTDNKIVQVVADTVSEAAGVIAGDEILELDGEVVESSRALRGMLRKKTNGDKFLLKVKRGDKEVELNGEFPAFVPKPVYVRKDPTGVVNCHFIGEGTPVLELATQNVTKLRVWLPAEMGQLEKIKMMHNNEESELMFTQRSPEEVLNDFARTASPASIYTAFTEIEVPGK